MASNDNWIMSISEEELLTYWAGLVIEEEEKEERLLNMYLSGLISQEEYYNALGWEIPEWDGVIE